MTFSYPQCSCITFDKTIPGLWTMSLSLFAKEELDVWLKNRWQLCFYLRFEINSPQKHKRNPQNEPISPQDWLGDARRGQEPSRWALDSWKFWSLSQGRGFVAKIRQRWGRPEMSWWPRTAGQGGVARRRQLITFRQVAFLSEPCDRSRWSAMEEG